MNYEIKAPYENALERIIRLRVLAIKHDKVKHDLGETQEQIFGCLKDYAEMEWEYEVKMQQF